MTLTNKDYIKICTIIILAALTLYLTVLFMCHDIKLDKELLKLTEEINTKLELLQELDTEQNIIIADLKLNLSDHEEDIQINFDDINRLQAELIDMKINNDRFSETAMIYCLDEIWDAITLLEKRIK